MKRNPASFASRVIYPAGNDDVHIYQELLRDELHDQLLWPLVCISETKEGKKNTTSFSLCISTIYSTLCKTGPNGSHSQILPLADLDLAGQGACKFCVGVHGGSLGLLRWLMETEGEVTGGGKKERQNKMKRLTYRVKRPCWQRWMMGFKAGGLGEINNLCVQLPQQERLHRQRNSCFVIMSIKTVFPPRKHVWWNQIFSFRQTCWLRQPDN